MHTFGEGGHMSLVTPVPVISLTSWLCDLGRRERDEPTEKDLVMVQW